jgi:hypothetical protein
VTVSRRLILVAAPTDLILYDPMVRVDVSASSAVARSCTRAVAGAALLAALTACGGPRGAAGGPPAPKPAPITDARTLLDAMARRYTGKWYQSLTYTLNNTTYLSGGRERKSQWLAAVSLPGKMRIDYEPFDSHSGVLYTGGKVYVFIEGRRQSLQDGLNASLVLTGDIYTQAVATTVRALDSLGFSLARFRRDTLQGRTVWVVGAATPTDLTTNQFWIDADRLLLVRIIQTEKQGTRTTTTDTRFDKYADEGGIPVAHEIRLTRNGQLSFKEEYAAVKVNPTLAPAVFDPAKWKEGAAKN